MTLDDETSIQMFSQARIEDLLKGMMVTVIGERYEEGSILARGFTVLPGERQGP